MSNIACRNVRREIEESGPGEPLSLVVSTHLESCAACETLSREQTSLQAIISSLGTVEAPGDFDFRLRARLAGERSGSARPFALGDFSLGFRSAAVAMVLLVIGAALAAVTFRGLVGNQGAGGAPVVSNSARPGSGAKQAEAVNTPAEGVAVAVKETTPDTTRKGSESQSAPPRKQRVFRNELASNKDRPSGIREADLTPARVLTPYDKAREGYPTAAFAINASYQSYKMSVDDGRGSPRTISVPTVSFGSQRTLSQNPSPLMASARGAW